MSLRLPLSSVQFLLSTLTVQSDHPVKRLCNNFVNITEVGFTKSLSMLRILKEWNLSIHLPEETLIGIISGIKVYIIVTQSKWQSLIISNSKIARARAANQKSAQALVHSRITERSFYVYL
jgi:hypothetical protein